MPTARLHFEDGHEVDHQIPDGQTVPYQLEHIDDGADMAMIRVFAYRRGQPGGENLIHYDEVPAKAESINKQAA